MSQKFGEPSTTVWAFDLGKGSLGEAVREGNKFLHKLSLRAVAGFGNNKPGGEDPRRVCLRNAFGQVYPHGG